MKLGIFAEEEAPIELEEAMSIARRLLVSWLNKGIIPSWNDFFKELPVLGGSQVLEAVKENFDKLTGLKILEEALGTEANEYLFHSPEDCQRILSSSKRDFFKVDLDLAEWQLWLEVLTIHFKMNWNVEKPFASFYGELFGKTYRLTLIHSSTSPIGMSKLVIRHLSSLPHRLESFGEAPLLTDLVRSRANFLVAGATGSGKTSLLSTLLSAVPEEEHVVILEDTFEINRSGGRQTRLLATEGAANSLRAYLTYALRLSPDRIILGEMRSHEVVPFLLAMNTGHRGLMGTIHASSASDALDRVGLLFSLYGGEANLGFDRVMELLCRNLEYVVFMENKKVKEVIKVLGSEKGVPFFTSCTSPGTLQSGRWT